MKKPVLCRMLPWLVTATGAALTIITLAAGTFGMDTDQKWGPFRVALLVLGLCSLLIPLSLRAIEAVDQRLLSTRPSSASEKKPDSRVDVDRGRFTLILVCILLILVYVGLVSVWHWTDWPATTNYYDMLADAFIRGQTALLTEPPAELAELPNPYPLAQRRGIKVIGDASYFRGKYYLYWGPAPSVFIAIWRSTTGFHVGDEVIVFIGISTTFIFSALIILYLKNRYFPSLPGWLLNAGVVSVATAHPMLWVLNSPSIYEAAIASGQAFLMAGLYFALPILDESHVKHWRFALVGALWAFAIGSRLVLTGAVVGLAGSLVLRTFWQAGSRRNWQVSVTRIAAMALPIIMGMALLLGYNYLRFGSLLETGMRYALTPFDMALLMQEGRFMSLVYLFPNLLYYFFAPIRLTSLFPFIRPIWDENPAFTAFLERFNVPDSHHVDSTTGLLLAMPTLLLAGTMAWESLCSLAQAKANDEPMQDSRNSQWNFHVTLGTLFLAGVLAAFPVLLFFSVASRYLLDASPLLAITSVIGAWHLYLSSRAYPVRGRISVISIIALIVAAALASFLLALSGADSRFDDLNPALYNWLVNFFSR